MVSYDCVLDVEPADLVKHGHIFSSDITLFLSQAAVDGVLVADCRTQIHNLHGVSMK